MEHRPIELYRGKYTLLTYLTIEYWIRCELFGISFYSGRCKHKLAKFIGNTPTYWDVQRGEHKLLTQLFSCEYALNSSASLYMGSRWKHKLTKKGESSPIIHALDIILQQVVEALVKHLLKKLKVLILSNNLSFFTGVLTQSFQVCDQWTTRRSKQRVWLSRTERSFLNMSQDFYRIKKIPLMKISKAVT